MDDNLILHINFIPVSFQGKRNCSSYQRFDDI